MPEINPNEVIEKITEQQEAAREWWLRDLHWHSAMIVAGVIVPFVLFYMFVIRPPADFPAGDIVSIESGSSLSEVAEDLKEQNVIRSAWWLQVAVRLFGGERGIIAGDYHFKDPQHFIRVARSIIAGDFGMEPIRVRIPEGARVTEIADIFAKDFPRFDPVRFVEKALPMEGYLFPDTYFFLPSADEDLVIQTMRENFDLKIEEISEELEAFERPLEDVVIMASILELEERRFEDRRMIAGVLWTRLEIGMPLQVDAVFLYILGRTTFDLTLEDLNVDSPYNTYRYTDLPPTPIGNPSLSSMRAAVTPIEHNYLFYLADRTNRTYYSTTYAEHLQKKRLYLD